MLTMAPLLIHSESVPLHARDALRAAMEAPAHSRVALLESAARILRSATGLECQDAFELVGLPVGSCG